MRIVTWNMGCGPRQSPYRRHHCEAWDYLLQILSPDVALLQEALVFKCREVGHSHSIALDEASQRVDATTAVLARNLNSFEIPTLTISPHTYTAAIEIGTPAGRLTCVSLHPFPGEHLHSDLKQTTAVIGALAAQRNVLIGGDFNVSRLWDQVYGGKKHSRFFIEMEQAGLYDAHWRIHGHEAQSVWTRRTTKPYQNDHIFITKGLAQQIKSCRVVDDRMVRRLSDHGPVILELDIDIDLNS